MRRKIGLRGMPQTNEVIAHAELHLLTILFLGNQHLNSVYPKPLQRKLGLPPRNRSLIAKDRLWVVTDVFFLDLLSN